jgi:hypothetical protein
MATVKGVNVTKYDAGGSGDNIISDGYIKTVEKVWIDTYAVDAAIASTTSIHIAKIPAGKKLTDVIVYLPVLGAAGQSTSTMRCSTTVIGNAGTAGTLGNLMVDGKGNFLFSQATACTLRLGPAGALTALTSDTDIYLCLYDLLATSITGGTIRSIVKYT